MTVGLGLYFTTLQLLEYTTCSFSISDGVYGTTFYMATGFHGFHVLIGTTFLLVCLIRHLKGHFTRTHHFGFEAAA
jgi:heme/copper-type cytochrome/quinol oxidase subunit 3